MSPAIADGAGRIRPREADDVGMAHGVALSRRQRPQVVQEYLERGSPGIVPFIPVPSFVGIVRQPARDVLQQGGPCEHRRPRLLREADVAVTHDIQRIRRERETGQRFEVVDRVDHGQQLAFDEGTEARDRRSRAS